jgi:DNA ligase (NAD+)
MDIDGFSIETIVKFLNRNIITDFADLYQIGKHRDTIIHMEGFGEKSFQNLVQAVEKSRDAEPVHLLFALCIPMIGTDAAKKIIQHTGFDGFLERLEKRIDFSDINGIGPEKSTSILTWYELEKNREQLEKLLREVRIQKTVEPVDKNGSCAGLTFVITGSLEHFKNRNELKAYIELQGGSVTGSVSSKTSFLINNDISSTSAKNRKATELGIPILTEEAFISRFTDRTDV